MRHRVTYADRETFDIRAASEVLYFGPRTAQVIEVVSAIHADMLADSERAQLELSQRIRQLRRQGVMRMDAIATIRKTDPELWDRAYPWHQLERTGVETIHTAALADTQAIHDAMYAGKRLPFTPCRTPVDAWRKYRKQETAA